MRYRSLHVRNLNKKKGTINGILKNQNWLQEKNNLYMEDYWLLNSQLSMQFTLRQKIRQEEKQSSPLYRHRSVLSTSINSFNLLYNPMMYKVVLFSFIDKKKKKSTERIRTFLQVA